MADKELTFTERLVDIQSRLKAPKGQYNSFGKYKYRSCEDILEAVKPLLAEHGLMLTLRDEIVHIGCDADTRYYVKATAYIEGAGGCAFADAYAREDREKKGMDGSQITGTASSYARKYALNGLFLIDDTKDADTDEAKKAQQAAQSASEPKEDAPKASVPPKAAPAPENRPQTLEEARTAFKAAFIHYRDFLPIPDKEQRTAEAKRLLTEAVGEVSLEESSATELSRAAAWLKRQVPNE